MSKQKGKKQNKKPKEAARANTLASVLEGLLNAPAQSEQHLSREELEKRADEVVLEMQRSLVSETAGMEAEAAVEASTDLPAESTVVQTEPEEQPEEAEAIQPETVSDETAGEGAETLSEEAVVELPETLPEDTEEPTGSAEAEKNDENLPDASEDTADSAEERPETEDVPEQEAQRTDAGSSHHETEKSERRRRREAARASRAEEREILAEDRAIRIEEFRQKREAIRREKRAEQELQAQKAEAERRNVPELTVEEAGKEYASGIPSLRKRLTPAFLIALVMALFTFIDGAAFLPEALRSGIVPAVILLVMQLVVIVLGADVLFTGVMQLARMKPGIETMVLAANLAAIGDAAMILAGFDKAGRQPYCAAAAAALAFCMWGSYCRRCGFRDTFRALRLASVPTVVSLEKNVGSDESILNKRLGSARGFLNKCTDPDLAERFITAVAPWYLLAVFLLSVVGAYLSDGSVILHSAACLTSAAVTLSAGLVYSRPFAAAAKRLIGNGAALAGWSGAQDMLKAGKLVVRDLDVFPENTITLNGMKVLPGAMAEKLVAYTGSVILATGSGLKRVFGELMRQHAAPLYQVDEFDCGTEGGICAYIQKEQVLVGSSAYMNLMGLRVPSSMEVSGAIYTAIDHELYGLFVVQYAPIEAVQSSLYLLETGKLKPVFAVRDFNIHPSMMTQKFHLTEGSVVFRPVEERYALSEEQENVVQPAALLSREGLWHYLETARSGRRLVRTVRRALVMTAIGSVLGVLIGFISFARGAFSAVQPWKLLAAMLLWAFATLMIAESADGD